jgi:hypothetical protein
MGGAACARPIPFSKAVGYERGEENIHPNYLNDLWDLPPADLGNDPLYPNDPIPSATPPPGTGAGGVPGNVNSDPNVLINPPGYDPVGGGGGQEPLYGGYGTFPAGGNPISGPTQIPTDWVNYPGMGMVPRAVSLGGPQASTNLWDYLNPFGGTSRGGSGTGDPTQRNVGRVVGTASNFFLPGSGFITGPLARWVTHLVQSGMSPQQARQVVQQATGQGRPPPMPSGSVSLPTHGGGGGGGLGGLFGRGNNPVGWLGSHYDRGSPGDFGRGPGGEFGNNASGFGSNTTSFIGGGGNPNLPVGGSYFGGRGNLGMSLPGSFYNLGGSGGNLGNAGAKLAFHSGRFANSGVSPEGYALIQNFLQGGGAHRGGSGAGLGGAGRPMTLPT